MKSVQQIGSAPYIANLAKKLEADKHPPETVATFLMRCLFTMFAEDVGLLGEGTFTNALRDFWIKSPKSFPGGIESLWRAMNEGGDFFTVGRLLKFNGGLFAQPSALPLDEHALRLLLMAAECNWADVEPAIFGTLLERALDPKERHRLGAHYTPRAYVERLVRPTIEEPLRSDWDLVQAQVRKLIGDAHGAKTDKDAKKKTKDAANLVREFHKKLATTRVLDPACGSGNFLYVTLDLFKRLEGEVLATLEGIGEKQELLHMESVRVTPSQFLGIEVKRWAKEIAELVLWIGYLQWHFRIYGKNLPVPEPVLRDYKNIECRDAVLAYDSKELVHDEKTGKPITRWDGETMKKSPVTGEDVPDESARIPLYRYVNPRKANWPQADFIVGNPPFLGGSRMRDTLGSGYAEALRGAYDEVPESADLVMYWWSKAADLTIVGRVRRFGLITTKAIAQTLNRKVVERATKTDRGLSFVFAIPNHP
ncbi:MAG: type IIL restriction-modification enzyme MmeI [Polyangiaceae bacterium]|nr:type IIL restriction-modification enzyme MmeI [Polyangiaceae bacterium]